ncbi:AfsR/SARP family transcriptional regulator [Streptomyces geranii]|uniref:AfsR/SARP family transcriptional regulator n=1 Tax=Streptomyces geranii TaxID=2058923 RepID=UPI000D0348B6|nr:AfsR/SARP family transcriptional regulator [Streptomyces geranii]
MQFRILGTVAVGIDGAVHAVPGLRQRCLLASLLIQAPAVVPVSTLYGELWDESPPATVENALQAHVSRLRRTLVQLSGDPAAADLLRTRSSGYSLDVRPEDIDVNRFHGHLRRSQQAMAADDLPAALDLLEQALGLWRGTPLGDAASGPLCQSAATEWEEEYLSAREDAYSLRIRTGEPMRVVGELKRMGIAHPWRERTTELLMLALYRSGRQAEAVGVYNAARLRLVDELGMEPSPKLRGLFHQMLNQDPDLHDSTPLLRHTA